MFFELSRERVDVDVEFELQRKVEAQLRSNKNF